MTLVAILFVDRLGRKPLLYVGLRRHGVALAALAFVRAPASIGALATVALVA